MDRLGILAGHDRPHIYYKAYFILPLSQNQRHFFFNCVQNMQYLLDQVKVMEMEMVLESFHWGEQEKYINKEVQLSI